MKILFTPEGREEVAKRIPGLIVRSQGFFEREEGNAVTDIQAMDLLTTVHDPKARKAFPSSLPIDTVDTLGN